MVSDLSSSSGPEEWSNVMLLKWKTALVFPSFGSGEPENGANFALVGYILQPWKYTAAFTAIVSTRRELHAPNTAASSAGNNSTVARNSENHAPLDIFISLHKA